MPHQTSNRPISQQHHHSHQNQLRQYNQPHPSFMNMPMQAAGIGFPPPPPPGDYHMTQNRYYDSTKIPEDPSSGHNIITQQLPVRPSSLSRESSKSSQHLATPEQAVGKASHRSDEEAAATALLMSAVGQPRDSIPPIHKRVNSADGNAIADIAHVSPSSNGGSQDEGVGDHDSIQGEVRVNHSAAMRDFPKKLHELLTSEKISSFAHWSSCGKAWKVVDWHEFSNVMPRYFPKLCEAFGGNDESLENRKKCFLNELERWEFENYTNDGVAVFSHEFFIKIAPNLCKYMKPQPLKTNANESKEARDQILSPPRIGRFGQQNVASGMESIFNGRNTNDIPTNIVSRAKLESENTSFRYTSFSPSFTLVNDVSPNTQVPRGALQSNRGRSPRAKPTSLGKRETPFQAAAFPVSKRGRGRRNVSSRGGRRKVNVSIQHE